ncbi:hypothetical protein MASR1M68_14090 [Elusimicrobiota bacterium]
MRFLKLSGILVVNFIFVSIGYCNYIINTSSSISNQAYQDFSQTGDGGVFDVSGTGILSIASSTFYNNNATVDGGAIHSASGGVINITGDTIFELNSATEDGGAIFNRFDSILNISSNVIFSSNTAGFIGGAVYNGSATANINNNVQFINNTAGDWGGAICNGYYGELIIQDNVIFSSNTAIRGGAIFNNKTSTTTISNGAVFSNNTASGTGGAIYNQETINISDNVTFSSNTANNHGGAIYNSGILNISNGAIFSNNTAGSTGGAILNSFGGNIGILNLIADTNNIEFTGNTANGISNAIHDSSGTINLWTGTASIIFNDRITSEDNTSVMNINQSSGTLPTNGTIILNEDMSGYTGSVNLYNGALQLVEGNSFFNTSTFTITGGNFIANASDVGSINNFTNNGLLTFTGGDNVNDITGSGEVEINTAGTVTNSGMVMQSTVSIIAGQFTNTNIGAIISTNVFIADGATLLTYGEIDTHTLGGVIDNEGFLQINVDSNTATVNNQNIITGTGQLDILGNTNFVQASGVGITQSTMTIAINASMTAQASDLTISNEIQNDGTLTFTFNGGTYPTNNNVITGSGVLNIAGLATTGRLSTTKDITQDTINVIRGNFFANSANINAIYMNVISGNFSSSNATINVSTVTVYSGASMYNTNSIVNANIVNNGTLSMPNGNNSNNISGSGTFLINGNISHNDGYTINQGRVEVYAGSSYSGALTNLNTDENSIIATNGFLIYYYSEIFHASRSASMTGNASSFLGDIENRGNLTFNGGTNKNTITGAGTLHITGDVANNANVNQGNLSVLNGASLTSTHTATSIMFTGSITNSGAIISSGTLQTKTLTNNLGATITNDGDFTVTNGGINSGAINGTGDLFVGGNFSNNGNITQSTVTINQNASLSTNADDLDVEIINNNGTLNLKDTADSIFAGDISGAGSLEKTGEGIIELTGNNIYTGTTTITQGSLQISQAYNLGNGLIIMNGGKLIASTNSFTMYNNFTATSGNNINIDVINNGVLYLKGVVNSSATLVKGGDGILEIGTDGDDFRTYALNIDNGKFYINNIESGKDFIVDSTMTFTNSLLGGNSNIEAGTLVMGTGAMLAPGNSIGTINIAGDLVFASSSTYEVEFEQTNMQSGGVNNDLTSVTGSVTIDSLDTELNLINLDGKYFVHETFDVLASSGGITGEFANSNISGYDIDTPDLRLGSRIDYSTATVGNALQVTISRKASDYGTSAELADMSYNQKEVAKAVDSISTGNGGDITNLLNALEQYYYYTSTYNLDALKTSFNDMTGVVYANASLLPYFNAKTEHVYDKIQSRKVTGEACEKVQDKIWGEYYYNNIDIKEDENSPKYQVGMTGFLVGFDMISEKSLMLGIMSGYGDASLTQKNDKTSLKTINVGLYGGYETDKWQFKTMLLSGIDTYNTEREITFMNETAKSDYQGYNVSLDFKGEYKILLTKEEKSKHKVILKPFAGILTSYIMQSGFEEKGADALNLKVEGNSILMAQARLGIGITGQVNKFG